MKVFQSLPGMQPSLSDVNIASKTFKYAKKKDPNIRAHVNTLENSYEQVRRTPQYAQFSRENIYDTLRVGVRL